MRTICKVYFCFYTLEDLKLARPKQVELIDSSKAAIDQILISDLVE